MHETAKHARRGKPLQVRARLGEPAADTLDLADPEAVADEGVQPDPAGDDVAAGLLPGDLDAVRRERVERLGLDQRQLVAAAGAGERAGSAGVAVAVETATRDSLCLPDALERRLGRRCHQESGDDAARLGGSRTATTSRPSWNGATRRPRRGRLRPRRPAGSSIGPDGTPNISTASRPPSGASTAAIQ